MATTRKRRTTSAPDEIPAVPTVPTKMQPVEETPPPPADASVTVTTDIPDDARAQRDNELVERVKAATRRRTEGRDNG